MTARHQNLRYHGLLILGIALLPQLVQAQESTAPPRIQLRMGLYVNPDVSGYDPDFWIGNVTHLRVGFWLASDAEEVCNTAFASFRVLQRSPFVSDRKDLADLDYVLIVENVHAEGSGMMTWVVDVNDTFAVYTTTGNRVYGSTEKETQKVRFGWVYNLDTAKRKAEEAVKDSLGSTIKEFLTKFAKTEAAANPPPPLKAPGPTVGTLLLSTEPRGAQVYLDDQFKGSTSEQEGRLVVSNLAAGTYSLRVSQAGRKDWVQSITVNSGEELRLQATLVPAGPTALTLKEVENALRNGVPKPRVLALVERYGVSFNLTGEAEQRLRDAGADGELLLSISKNRK